MGLAGGNTEVQNCINIMSIITTISYLPSSAADSIYQGLEILPICAGVFILS
jgi:hypothetical protein